jgi:hypothetical protein
MSFGGRTILINASFSNASIYHMSMFLLPKKTIENLDKQRRRVFFVREEVWKGNTICKMVKNCRDKKKGG